MSYHPTIWRTCRVLANKRRLACLKAVLRQPGESVGVIAAAAQLPQDQASLCLRALQARGLLHASRESRWVHYFPWPDPLVPVAAPILASVSHAVLKERLSETRMIRCLTAFTHPRRLEVLRCLQQNGPLPFMALVRRSRISSTALSRHLKKLEARSLVLDSDAGWALNPEHEPLADTFLTLLAHGPEA
ncbi:MAG: helix-turn-helix domain-containing protein [bacterium]